MKQKVKPRAYRSKVREEAALRTRRTILEAANRLLLRDGYGAMTMQQVAAEAEVALDTVYAAVGRKPVLMRLLVESAISGTDQPVPAAERHYVQRMQAARSAAETLSIYAGAIAEIHARLAPIVRALQAAATEHPELRGLWHEISERRARNMKLLAKELVATGDVRSELTADRVGDILWSMNAPEFFLLFCERGWTAEQFAEWLGDAWVRVLLVPARARREA